MEQIEESEDVALDEELADDAVPVCPHCLAEITPEQYYCHMCAYPTGQLTGLLPFVNIPFQAFYLGGMWRKIWYGQGVSLVWRACLLLLLFLLAPVIVIVGLPFVIAEKLRGSRKTGTTPDKDDA